MFPTLDFSSLTNSICFAAVYGYLWVGVFTLFKQLRKQEIAAALNAASTATATLAETTALTSAIITSAGAAVATDSSFATIGRSGLWISDEHLDEPPSYVLAVQEIKYSFEYEAPPTYFDAILIAQSERNLEEEEDSPV